MTGDVTDAAGIRHDVAPDARILSLVPSLTETLFALGLGPQIVGRTAFCIHPDLQIKSVKSVGGTKQLNWRKVETVQPTHAVLNIDENPKEMATELEARGIVPVTTHPLAPEDNGPLVRLLGAVFDRPDEARALAEEFENALAAFEPPTGDDPVRVLYLIWKAPWMTVSDETYISRFLALAGWRTVAPGDGRYPEIEITEDLLARTDRVLFSSEPFPFKEEHLAAFRAEFPAHGAKAQLVDGEMLSWYGVRAKQGLRYLKTLTEEVPR